MRKLLILTALCLVFVATSAMPQKAKAAEHGSVNACTVAQIILAADTAVETAICYDDPHSQDCADAQAIAWDSWSEMVRACGNQ
jgi:hypothetical protein